MIDIVMYHARIGTFQVPHSKMKKKKGDDKAKISGVSIYIYKYHMQRYFSAKPLFSTSYIFSEVCLTLIK